MIVVTTASLRLLPRTSMNIESEKNLTKLSKVSLTGMTSLPCSEKA